MVGVPPRASASGLGPGLYSAGPSGRVAGRLQHNLVFQSLGTQHTQSTQHKRQETEGEEPLPGGSGGAAGLFLPAGSLSATTICPGRAAAGRVGTSARVSATSRAVKRRSAGLFAPPRGLRCNTRRVQSSFAGLSATTRELYATTGDAVSTSRKGFATSREAGATRRDPSATYGEASSRCVGPGGTTRELAS